MRRPWKGWASALAVCGLLAGCAVAPARYYALGADAPARPAPAAAPASASAQAPAYGLRLQVLQVPAQADRPQIVVRDPASAPQVQILNDSLWSAPLVRQIQAVLSGQIAGQLGVPAVDRLEDDGLAVRKIALEISRFDLVWGRQVLLAASWTDQLPNQTAPKICRATFSESVPALEVAALVRAQGRLLSALARAVVHPQADQALRSQGLQAITCTGQ